MPACAACGQANPDGFTFCGACGSKLVADAPKREVRKTVTVVFTDISGSTALGERLDPEALRKTMASYFEEIRRIIERHGGTVEKFIGDAAMAVFGIPVAEEDDALRAVEGGEKLVRRAVERAAEIDFYDHKARAFELFAQTLGLAGKRSEAVQAARDALAIYEAKGDEAATASARALVASLFEGSAA